MTEYNSTPWVLGIDPGKATGLSLYCVVDGTMQVEEHNFMDTCERVAEWAGVFGSNLSIAIERFVITEATLRNSQAPWSLEMIGACRWLAGKYGVANFKVQEVNAAKRFGSDQRLKDLGWWVPGKGHGNDASRHTLLYMVTHGWLTDALVVS